MVWPTRIIHHGAVGDVEVSGLGTGGCTAGMRQPRMQAEDMAWESHTTCRKCGRIIGTWGSRRKMINVASSRFNLGKELARATPSICGDSISADSPIVFGRQGPSYTAMRALRVRLITCPEVWPRAPWMMPFLFTNDLPHLHSQAGFAELIHLVPHSHT